MERAGEKWPFAPAPNAPDRRCGSSTIAKVRSPVVRLNRPAKLNAIDADGARARPLADALRADTARERS